MSRLSIDATLISFTSVLSLPNNYSYMNTHIYTYIHSK